MRHRRLKDKKKKNLGQIIKPFSYPNILYQSAEISVLGNYTIL